MIINYNLRGFFPNVLACAGGISLVRCEVRGREEFVVGIIFSDIKKNSIKIKLIFILDVSNLEIQSLNASEKV